MAILCWEHDLLYIQLPATGSSVVARALQEKLGGEPVPEQPVRRNGDTVVSKTHCTVSELITHGLLSRECVDRCLMVANVRNPFDRWTTYYQRRAGGAGSSTRPGFSVDNSTEGVKNLRMKSTNENGVPLISGSKSRNKRGA